MRLCAVSLILATILATATLGQDWTQWGGPNRDFQLTVSPKASGWPASGPRQLWTRELGDGYSSMVTSGPTLYTEYRKGTREIVIALEAATGKTVWERSIEAPHVLGMNVEAGPGPHSTPLIAGDRIFVTTVIGHLVALDRKTGARLWSHDLWKEYKGNQVERGYSSSPMAYKDTIIVPVGGPGRALMSFRQVDGSVVWSKGDFENAYSSPILIHVAGRDQVVSFMAKHVMAADPATGTTLWSIGHRTSYDINAATPVWCDDTGMLVISSAYDGGARGIQVGSEAKELWHNNRLRVHHTNMVCKGGIVYGSSGDFGPAPLTAVESKTGRVLWQNRAFTKANFVLAGDRIFVADDDGSVAIATIAPEGMKVLAEAQLLQANSWTVPVVSDARLFVRDRHKLIALALE